MLTHPLLLPQDTTKALGQQPSLGTGLTLTVLGTNPPAIPPCRTTERALAEPRASPCSGRVIHCRKPTAFWGPGFPAGEMRGCVGSRGCAGQQDGSLSLLLAPAWWRKKQLLPLLPWELLFLRTSSEDSSCRLGVCRICWGRRCSVQVRDCLFCCLCSHTAGTLGHLLGTNMGVLIHHTQGSITDVAEVIFPLRQLLDVILSPLKQIFVVLIFPFEALIVIAVIPLGDLFVSLASLWDNSLSRSIFPWKDSVKVFLALILLLKKKNPK